MGQVLRMVRSAGNSISVIRTLSILVACLLANAAHAASVVQLSFDQLVTNSEIAFEGRVVSSESAWNADRTKIYTTVRFEVHDVLKGGPVGSVNLRFTGGTVDGMTMSVSGLRIPRSGESGVYFVESMEKNYLSPITGWNQGQFLISGEGGNRRVMTSIGKPVIDFVPVSAGAKTLNEDTPAGLMTDGSNDRAMSVGEFKAHVLDLMERSSKRREAAR